MTHHQTHEIDVDLTPVTEALAKAVGKGAVTFAFTKLVFKPFLEDVTGRKIRTAPMWLTIDALANALFMVPSLRARQLRREADQEKEIEESVDNLLYGIQNDEEF